MGKSIPALHWLFDLQISVGKLIGTLCSATLSSRAQPQLPVKRTEEEKAEEAVVHSSLWKSLLRGGYMVGKLTRSLSGAYVGCGVVRRTVVSSLPPRLPALRTQP